MNPFNPQYYGYKPATDNQLFNGSAPFVYNYLPHDTKQCIVAKNMYNISHSAVYQPDTIVRSHPASNIIQSATLKHHENLIKQQCTPSFRYDGPANNFGTNNF